MKRYTYSEICYTIGSDEDYESDRDFLESVIALSVEGMRSLNESYYLDFIHVAAECDWFTIRHAKGLARHGISGSLPASMSPEKMPKWGAALTAMGGFDGGSIHNNPRSWTFLRVWDAKDTDERNNVLDEEYQLGLAERYRAYAPVKTWYSL